MTDFEFKNLNPNTRNELWQPAFNCTDDNTKKDPQMFCPVLGNGQISTSTTAKLDNNPNCDTTVSCTYPYDFVKNHTIPYPAKTDVCQSNGYDFVKQTRFAEELLKSSGIWDNTETTIVDKIDTFTKPYNASDWKNKYNQNWFINLTDQQTNIDNFMTDYCFTNIKYNNDCFYTPDQKPLLSNQYIPPAMIDARVSDKTKDPDEQSSSPTPKQICKKWFQYSQSNAQKAMESYCINTRLNYLCANSKVSGDTENANKYCTVTSRTSQDWDNMSDADLNAILDESDQTQDYCKCYLMGKTNNTIGTDLIQDIAAYETMGNINLSGSAGKYCVYTPCNEARYDYDTMPTNYFLDPYQMDETPLSCQYPECVQIEKAINDEIMGDLKQEQSLVCNSSTGESVVIDNDYIDESTTVISNYWTDFISKTVTIGDTEVALWIIILGTILIFILLNYMGKKLQKTKQITPQN